jgi:hypothetical protein
MVSSIALTAAPVGESFLQPGAIVLGRLFCLTYLARSDRGLPLSLTQHIIKLIARE